MKKLLVVDSGPFDRKNCLRSAKDVGFEAFGARTFDEATALLRARRFDLVLLDMELRGGSAHLLLEELNRSHRDSVVAVLARPDLGNRGEAPTSSASFLLPNPPPRLLIIRLLEHFRDENEESVAHSGGIVGISSAVLQLRRTISSLKDWRHPVLLFGETGTGKELVAHAIHAGYAGRKGPFVTVDCGAVSPSLLENELFGHARGAYTGASTSQQGLVEAANRGTLFLDEIGDLPLECQSRLLRLLQENEIRPLGGTHAIPVDIRVVAATNVNLELAVRERRFREDLYYRLSAMTVAVPSLRERPEDISLLAHHFLRWSRTDKRLSLEALDRLHRYHWPGNIRELQNRILRCTALTDEALLSGSDILQEESESPSPAAEGTLANLEKMAILRAVDETNNDIVEAARRLGIGRTTLYRRLKSYRS